jgi:surface antigen
MTNPTRNILNKLSPILGRLAVGSILLASDGALGHPPDQALAQNLRRQPPSSYEDRFVDPKSRPGHYHYAIERPYPPGHDYGVGAGHCDRTTVGAALGGRAAGSDLGGLIGTGLREGHTGAVAGIVLGAVVGDRIGRRMDIEDRYCTGRALDFAEDQASVRWLNPANRASYTVTPLSSYRDGATTCREFTTRMTLGRQEETAARIACRQPDGTWLIRG